MHSVFFDILSCIGISIVVTDGFDGFTCSLTKWKVRCIDAEKRWRFSVGRRATDARDSGMDADQRSQMLWGCRVK